jgi:hypothetical protein
MQRETVEERTVYEHSMEIVMGSGARRAGASRSYDAKETFNTLKTQIG